METSIQLAGKVAIITGASRGIGAAIARGFVAHGARVVLAARKIDDLNRLADEIGRDHAHPVACHTGQPAQVAALVASTVERYGAVDILVNNAATNPYFGPLCDIPDAAFEKTFEVNVKGYFVAAREVIRHLRARGGRGAIVNIASVAGLRAAPFQGVYGMTKAAVISLTKTLAAEVGGQGIRVNAIAPGLIETRFAAAIVGNDVLRKMVVDRTPAARHGQPEEIVGAALYLASEAASYVNGHVLVVDGGMTAT
ncbi:MAG: glucose 1-dehydrogenase [Myxococcales bacterium]|nr:glucose 1-dehydrogenase [Myxococcales bacterium]